MIDEQKSRVRFTAYLDKPDSEKLQEALDKSDLSASSAFRRFFPKFLKFVESHRGKARAA